MVSDFLGKTAKYLVNLKWNHDVFIVFAENGLSNIASVFSVDGRTGFMALRIILFFLFINQVANSAGTTVFTPSFQICWGGLKLVILYFLKVILNIIFTLY